MVEILVAIKDVKAAEFTPGIMRVRTPAQAQRNFLEILYNPANTNFHRNPKDFVMYMLGTMNPETGEITPDVPCDITPHSEVDAYILRTASGTERYKEKKTNG